MTDQPKEPTLEELKERMESAWRELAEAETSGASIDECERLYDAYERALETYAQSRSQQWAAESKGLPQ